MNINEQIEATVAEIKAVAGELKDKSSIGSDRVQYLETELTRLSAVVDGLEAEKKAADIESRFAALEAKASAFATAPDSRALAISASTGGARIETQSVGEYNTETNWLKALVDARQGSPEANQFIKAVLGTSDATGQAIIPNNFVAKLVEQITVGNIYRQFGLVNFTSGVRSAGVDIPYEVTAITAALLQGANGSNKDVRDFAFNQATATLYTIAQIADIGNQLLRQSGGVAENVARRRLAKSIADTEATYIVTGTGSSQPLGLLPAFAAFGDPIALRYALNSEPRAVALGNGLAKLENLGRTATGIVMNPTDFWEMTTETLGTSSAGGWAMDPTGGATTPRVSVWGVPVYRDAHMTAGTAVLGDWSVLEAYLGNEYRIDVSDQAGSRWDQNVTGFRAEEDFGFTAEPWVRTGHFIKVTGL